MAGLPGAGKSAVAAALGRELCAPVLAVDAAEAAMWRSGIDATQRDAVGLAAYAVVHTAAAAALDAGHTVVVDAVNAVAPARDAWRGLAREHGVALRWIEVVCSDPMLHRARLEGRGSRYAELAEPTWSQVQARVVEPWDDDRLVLDSVRPLAELLPEALRHVTGRHAGR